MKANWLKSCIFTIAAAVASVFVLTACSTVGKPVVIKIPEIGKQSVPEADSAKTPKKSEASDKSDNSDKPDNSENSEKKQEAGFVKEDDGTAHYYINGEIQKNGIVGDEKNGYYYADGDGVINLGYCDSITANDAEWNIINGKATKVTTESDLTLNAALKAVAKCTKNTMSREEKLRACFDYLKTNYLEGVRHDPPYNEMDWPVVYANDIFVYGKGDCFSYGAAFAYMAKAIGYTEAYACNTGGHGWAEVDGKYYDPEWDMHHNEYNHFGVAPGDDCDVDYVNTLQPDVEWMRIKV